MSLVAACGAALSGSAFGASAATHHISGGKTTIVLNASSAQALKSHHFALTATGRATLSGRKLTLPVTGGTYDSGIATIKSTGGFRLSKGSHAVTIKNIVTHTASLSATAFVTGHGRIKAFTAGFPKSIKSSGRTATITGYTVTMSSTLVGILNGVFSTTQFTKHAEIGTGTTHLRFKN